MLTLSASDVRFALSVDETGALAVPPRLPNGLPDTHPAMSTIIAMAAALTIDHRQYALVGGATQGQANLEVRPGLVASDQLHRAAVRLDALGDDRESDARASDGASLGPAALVKGLEDSIGVLGVNPGPVVRDVDHEVVAVHARANRDHAAARREFDRVRHQVLEHELELAFVREHIDRAHLELELDLLV